MKARNNGRTPFYVACRYGKLDVVRYMIDSLGVDVNHQQLPGVTPFHIACARGQVEVVSGFFGGCVVLLSVAWGGFDEPTFISMMMITTIHNHPPPPLFFSCPF
jgi:hypothetical protein